MLKTLIASENPSDSHVKQKMTKLQFILIINRTLQNGSLGGR